MKYTKRWDADYVGVISWFLIALVFLFAAIFCPLVAYLKQGTTESMVMFWMSFLITPISLYTIYLCFWQMRYESGYRSW